MFMPLQIPPPKPPPPEMHFIPNPTNSEFIYLLGLEECVSKYLNEDKPPGPQPIPFSCSQCHTDFTPTWKWDREKGAKGILLFFQILFSKKLFFYTFSTFSTLVLTRFLYTI